MNNIPLELLLSPPLVERLLVAFLRDEVRRVGLERAVLGLSGGIDSALVCFLCAKALGPANVAPIIMPAAASSPDSVTDALAVIKALNLPRWRQVSVSPEVETYFQKPEVPRSADEAEMKNRIGNKMARERMTILYDFSVVERALVIGTSNKTELLLGYGTLHGDMASAINPIGDLFKMQVYQMAQYLGVPDSIINKPPTADLWAGQTDEGQLGFTYADVDRLLWAMVDHRRSKAELLAMGFAPEFIARVAHLVRASQFKRRLPVIAKVSERTIDRDFNYARDWGT
ncbi:MAG: NAD+ synthase [Myxococcales bacterium]|nr:MAG: NAD+ synthase [Myxococcales bacterium]